ncbi:hypothetical protein C8A00DRAFT_18989 [Chaetomidium leptoderma]|uniref:Uncharacterized protein n=1 Tax=Chaetomidium leptoderma TaxID=669021 RepID=A0AAN6ZT56_9PEZI|nr:hypothetical protein C8A00DRAFT_18989 [Chaetomidium leptoderma]
MSGYTYPQLVKYRCHVVHVGQLRNEGCPHDRKRFRKVVKQDEWCPKCEKRVEKEMYRTLHWLNHRTG